MLYTASNDGRLMRYMASLYAIQEAFILAQEPQVFPLVDD